ncbi:MAG: FG-GAP-like repeat-containing protein [Bacteroidota bacterium]|nr:FG-GAP-like repeat-containing protein [Bacteroidota bacterium]
MNPSFLFFILILLFSLFSSFHTLNKDKYFADESNKALKLQHPSLPPVEQSVTNFPNECSKFSKGTNSSFYNDAIENLQREEYNISYNEELKCYQSPNRANNIRFSYHDDGFTAMSREHKIPLFDVNDRSFKVEDKKYKTADEWEINFKVKGYSRSSMHLVTDSKSTGSEFKGVENDKSDKLISFLKGDLKVNKNKASTEDDNLRIEYTNNEIGMRQDFIVKNKPTGKGNLRLELSGQTKLKMSVDANALTFKDKKGKELMRYSGLKVWDANGKKLQAYFENREDYYSENENRKSINENKQSQTDNDPKLALPNPKSFAIVVNDKDADYPVTIDPLSISPNWVSECNQIDAAFGFSVSTAGDVNGDGFDDVIIGAPFYDNNHANEGKVFVYLGSLIGLLNTATWSAVSNQADSYFGWSVSTAGDVNNDGYSDIIIGANSYDQGQTDEGRAFVYHGSISGLSLTPNWTGECNQSNSQYGWAVSTAGDLNNDGYSDVVVGAPLFDNVQSDEGRAFIYFGSASGLSNPVSQTAESNQPTAHFGGSVSTAADVNGDGFSDIIVGANTYDNPLRDQGCSFVYLGSATGIASTSNWSTPNIQSFFSFLGCSVSSAGDINGDGYSDIITGADSYDNVETDEGKVFVYYGSATGLPATANWTTESNQPYAHMGNSVSGAGDFNNDGYSDVIIGAKEFDNGQSNEGGAFIYFGSSTGLSNVSNVSMESNQINSYFGTSVSCAGDVNADGYSDVIVGAYIYDNGQSNEGRAFVYHGSASTTKILSLTMFTQGLYNANTNLMTSDTLRVYLRNVSSPYAVVDSAKTFMNTSGFGNFNFSNVSNGVNYYIQLKHRNSIKTWSATGQSFTAGALTYNFSTGLNKAFGNNMRIVDNSPVRYAIYSGDVNQDGAVDLADGSIVENAAQNFTSGYVNSDLNGDLTVDITDAAFADNSAYRFVTEIAP